MTFKIPFKFDRYKLFFLVRPFGQKAKSENFSKGSFISLYFLSLTIINVFQLGIIYFFPNGNSSILFLPPQNIIILTTFVFFFLYFLSRMQYLDYVNILYLLYGLFINFILFFSLRPNDLENFMVIGAINILSLLYFSYFIPNTKQLIIYVLLILSSFLYIPIFEPDFSLRNFYSLFLILIIVSFSGALFNYYASKKMRTLLDLNHKLELEKDLATESNEAKSEFLSKMSHEMRNNLQIINGYISIMQDTREYNEEFIRRIGSSTSNVLNLVDDFLDLKLIEIGKISINLAPTNIKEKLKQTFNFFILQFESKNLSYNLDIDDSIPNSLLMDNYRLNQILINLIQNSIKYTIEGFVKVKLSLKNENEKFCTVIYEVEDSGLGIKDNDKPLLFKSFQRTSNSLDLDIKGVGLGLAIVSNLVHAFNGKIWFESQYKQGTKFFIELKLQKILN